MTETLLDPNAAIARAPRQPHAISAEFSAYGEPLAHVAYLHDGTLEGLLCCIFEAYANREFPEDIVAEGRYQPRLDQSCRIVETDFTRAVRVRNGIEREAGPSAFYAVVRAAASDAYDAGAVVYRFVRYIMDPTTGRNKRANVMNDLANPAIANIARLERRTANEEEKMRQFVRFRHLSNDVWFARCNPNCNVIPLVMTHFVARFNIQPFIIYDEVHHIAGVYDGSDWQIVRSEVAAIPEDAPNEALIQQAWQRFYDALSINDRYNPELRRSFMPVRLWKNLTEMQTRVPENAAHKLPKAGQTPGCLLQP